MVTHSILPLECDMISFCWSFLVNFRSKSSRTPDTKPRQGRQSKPNSVHVLSWNAKRSTRCNADMHQPMYSEAMHLFLVLFRPSLTVCRSHALKTSPCSITCRVLELANEGSLLMQTPLGWTTCQGTQRQKEHDRTVQYRARTYA